ncbi:MAG TPA: hypothetical protein VFX30_10980 [bacterium]|nr:hypothetical protein [bacterium]
MLDRKLIKDLFRSLNGELAKMRVTGEIGLCGGAVMCLVFQAREATKDVDGLFEPTEEMRRAAGRVAKEFGIEEGWLNDAAKTYFLTEPPRQSVMELSHLRIWAPSAEYMLAMKCISARFDSHDKDDVIFLIRHLELEKPAQVFRIVENYYPNSKIPPKTQFLIEEVMA